MRLFRVIGIGAAAFVVGGVASSLQLGVQTMNAPSSPVGLAFSDKVGTGPTDNRITQDNIKKTICAKGYTKSVRPPTWYTNQVKGMEMAGGGDVRSPTTVIRMYHVVGTHINQPLKLYELDHVVPLAVAGNPEDPINLKLQPWNGPDGAHLKDRAENKVHSLVCYGTLSLAQGQQVFLTGDWKEYAK